MEWLQRLTRGQFPQVKTGIGDDAAILGVRAGSDIAATTDFFLEGVHFRRTWFSAAEVGRRCVVRGLSDLAAMGAEPRAIFLSLAVPRELAGEWTTGFLRGAAAAAKKHGTALAGGDLAASPALVAADVVALGEVPRGRALLRSGARPGDQVCVTGRLGGAAASLARLLSGEPVAHPHRPRARVAAGLALRQAGATACMDLSDGLSLDLFRLVQASGVCAEVDAALVPVARGATLEQALHGGEDYELLFTLPAKAQLPPRMGGVPVRRIGRITKKVRGAAAVLLLQGGVAAPLPCCGFRHF